MGSPKREVWHVRQAGSCSQKSLGIVPEALLQGGVRDAVVAPEKSGPASQLQGAGGRPQAGRIEIEQVKERGQADSKTGVASGSIYLATGSGRINKQSPI